MSLPVPLTVRVGDTHITREVESVGFRREAVGGVRSLTFRLRRPIDQMPAILAPFSRVTVYDARTAEPVAQGRLADSGRSADGSGQSWEVVAFGPAQHASDITAPLVYVDRSFDGWLQDKIAMAGAGVTFASGIIPDGKSEGLVSAWSDGTAVQTNSLSQIRYSRVEDAAMKLARVSYNFVMGVASASWKLDAMLTSPAGLDIGPSDSWTTTLGLRTVDVVTHFANGRSTAYLRAYWIGGAATVGGATNWAWAGPVVESLRLDKAGVEVTTGYYGYVRPHHIVEDLLGRVLPEFDGAGAVVDATSAYDIEQLAYVDGVSAESVLSDLMRFAPSHRWYTTPDVGNGYGFRWELWPTAARYEVTLDDGGAFPLSGQSLYNRVVVRWQDISRRVRSTIRTGACPALDENGLTRQALVDISGEAGSLANAEQVGDAFLAEHNVPKNSGSITVTRPIRDVLTGRLVDPWEIEAGELVRVRGVESYPDALNADSADGRSVFRIFAVEYDSESNAARLELDADPRDTASALAKLMTERTRR